MPGKSDIRLISVRRNKKHMKSKILFLLLILICSIQKQVYASRDLPDDNLSYPVLIALSDGSTGSGFYLNTNTKYYFVTAKHVLFKIPPPTIVKKYVIPENKSLPVNINKFHYNDYEGIIEFEGQMTQEELKTLLTWAQDNFLKKIITELYDESQYKLKATYAALQSYSSDIKDEKPNIIEFNLADLLSTNKLRYSDDYDIAVIEFGMLNEGNLKTKKKDVKVRSLSQKGFLSVNIDTLKTYDDILIGNEVFVFGFPTSIGLKNTPQINYNRPLLRKGIVAGINNKLKTIIIDCPVYFGNSGGPVIEVEREGLKKIHYKVIGIVTEFVPFVEKINNITQNYQNINVTNSGYAVVVPTDFILELIETAPNNLMERNAE